MTYTRKTFERHDHGTNVLETSWPGTGMRSVHSSFSDGTVHLSLITHDNDRRDRQASASVHDCVDFDLEASDDALTITVHTTDGTRYRLSLFGTTLEQVLEALAKATVRRICATDEAQEDTPA